MTSTIKGGRYLLSDSLKRDVLSDPAKKSKGIGRSTYIITAKQSVSNKLSPLRNRYRMTTHHLALATSYYTEHKPGTK